IRICLPSGRILASFPRLAGAEFVSLTTETFCRAFSAVFGAYVSKSVFGGTAVSDCLAGGSSVAAGASQPSRALQGRLDRLSRWTRSDESERSPLGAPVDRKTSVGHKLVRSKIGGLFAAEDRCNNVRREVVQSDQASGVGPAHVLLGGGVFQRRARIGRTADTPRGAVS